VLCLSSKGNLTNTKLTYKPKVSKLTQSY